MSQAPTTPITFSTTTPHAVATFQATFRRLTTVSLMSDQTLTFNNGAPFGAWSEVADCEGHGPLQRFQVTWHWSGAEVANKMSIMVFVRVRGSDAWLGLKGAHNSGWETMYMFPVTRPSELDMPLRLVSTGHIPPEKI